MTIVTEELFDPLEAVALPNVHDVKFFHDRGCRPLAYSVRMAKAEAWAKARGVEFIWEDDWETDHQTEFDCYWSAVLMGHGEYEGPLTCEHLQAFDPVTSETAQLGCIDDATPEYRRLVETELALELLYLAVEG